MTTRSPNREKKGAFENLSGWKRTCEIRRRQDQAVGPNQEGLLPCRMSPSSKRPRERLQSRALGIGANDMRVKADGQSFLRLLVCGASGVSFISLFRSLRTCLRMFRRAFAP